MNQANTSHYASDRADSGFGIKAAHCLLPSGKATLGLIALALASAAASAQTEPELQRLADVTVTAGERSLVEPNLEVLPTAELNRETYKARPGSEEVGDVLQRLPGVFMGGPPGENKDIRLRGLDKEFTRFQLGSVQLPGGGEKREFQVNRLSSLLIGDVTIIRNPTAEFESDGIAGRVIADRPAIPDAFEADLETTFGGVDGFDGDLWSIGARAGDRRGDFGYSIAAEFRHDAFNKDKTKEKFKGGTLDEVETEFEEKPADMLNLVSSFSYFPSEAWELRLEPTVVYRDEEKDKLKIKTKPAKNEREDETETESKVQATYGLNLVAESSDFLGGNLKSELGYFTTLEDKDKTKRKEKFKGGTFDGFEDETEDEEKEDQFWETATTYARESRFIVPGEFKTGFEFRFRDRFRDKDKLKSKNSGAFAPTGEAKDDYEVTENLYMGFAQNEFRLTDQFSILPGVRIEHQTLESSTAGLSEDSQRTDINPNLHLKYDLTGQIKLNGALSRSVNRPKFDELAPFRNEKGDRVTEGNPSLEPGTSWNFDAGVAYDLDKRLFLAANVFYKEIEGVIEEVDTGTVDASTGKDLFRVENVGDGQLYGIELEQQLNGSFFSESLNGINLWANQAFIDSELTDASGQTRPFKEQPDYIINAGFDYILDATGTWLSLAARFLSEIEKIEATGDREVESARESLDFGLRQRITDDFYLTFDIVNITGESKEKRKEKAGGGEVEFEREESGTTYFVGASYTF